MPGTTTSLATFRPDIPGAMEEFSLEMNEAGYIALEAASLAEVGSPSEQLGKLPIEALLQEVASGRSPGANYKSPSDYEMEAFSYAVKEHGLVEPVDDTLRRIYSRYFDAEVMATKRIRGMVGRNFESRVAALYAAIATTTAAGAYWTVASTDVMGKVEEAANAVVDRTGYWPNTMILTRKIARALRFNTAILDRAKYNGIIDVTPDKINANVLAQIFDVERVVIADARKNTANVKKAATLSSIWPNTEAYLSYVDTSQDPIAPTFARVYHWGEDGSQIGGVVETYRDEGRRSDMVRVRMQTDEKTVYAEMGQRITGVAA